jgi:hypothetical protein
MWRRRRARAAPLSGKFPFVFFFFVLINVWKNKNLPTTTTTIYRLIRSRESPREKKGQQKITISEKQRDVGWCASLLRVDNTDKLSLVTASPRRLYYIYCKYWKPWKGLLLVTYQMSAVFNEAWRESRGRSHRVRSSLSEFDRGKQRIKLKKMSSSYKNKFQSNKDWQLWIN